MNKETFINYIQNNQLLGKESISDFTDLSEEFPYCSSVHLLLAMNLRKEDHFRYDSELKRAAIYAADRGVLRKHIENLNKAIETTVLPDEDSEVVEKIELLPAEVKEVVEESDYKSGAEAREEEVAEVEEKTEVRPEEEVVEEIEVPSENNPEELPEIEEALTEVVDDTSAQVESPTEKPGKIELSPTVREDEDPVPDPVTGEDTLNQLKKIVANRLKQIEKERQVKAEVIKEVKTDEKQIAAKPPVKKKQDKAITELIDNFIKTEPSITRRKASFFDPVDASKESVTDEENIVSETLAAIYFDQGKYEKAIRLYKKLSLKFPEKSSYFAARIEKAVEELKK